MPTRRIKPSEAQALANVLLDANAAGQLSPGQVETMTGQLKQYQEQQLERNQRFTDEGFNQGEVARLVDKENQALESGEAQTGGTIKRHGAPGQGQFFGMSRLINGGMEGAWQAFEGLGDVTNEAGVALNLNSREDADRYKEVVRTDRFKRRMDDITMFGQVNNAAAEFAGEIAPWVATGGVGGGQGLARWALTQGLIGGAAATSTVSDQTLAERKGEFGIGFGLGTVFQSAFGAPQAIRRRAANAMVGRLNIETAANNVELEGQILQMLNEESFGFSLAQITGNRYLAGLETRAAGQVQKQRQNQNIQVLFDNLMDKAKKLGDEGRSADEIGLALNETLSAASKSIHKRASGTFEDGLNALHEDFGDDIILDYTGGQDYLFKLDVLLGELDDGLRPGVKASESFKRYRGEVDAKVNPVTFQRRTVKGPDGKNRVVYDLFNRRSGELDKVGLPSRGEAMAESLVRNEQLGGLQAEELVRITRGLNDMLAGRTAAVEGSAHNSIDRTTSKALMGELMSTLQANNNNPVAVQALDDLRNGYKSEMLRISKMEDMVVNRVFGQAKMPVDPDDALDKVMGGGKSSLVNTRAFLEEWNPGLLDELQGTYLRRIAERSQDVTLPAVDVPISIDKMATNLAGKGGIGDAGMGLFDAATQADLKLTGQALRVIKNIYFTGIVPGGSTVDDLAINVISRSPEFMGRFLTRALSGGDRMSEFLVDPLTRKAIQRVAEGNLNSPTGVAAMLTITNFINNADAVEAQQAAGERRSQTANAMNRTSEVLQ